MSTDKPLLGDCPPSPTVGYSWSRQRGLGVGVYLSAMTDVIEEEGGFVDKYIGDAIVAIFGAPTDQPDHAARAVCAALRCQARLAEMNGDPEGFRAQPLGQRIGLNTGEVLVGNIGSRRRFNYTVMGDAVNLASRLEGANKFFGTAVLASEATRSAAGDAFAWREIDCISVKGREQPVHIYQPFSAAVTPAQRLAIDAYRSGLKHWREGAFAEAADTFAAVADEPARLFAIRAQSMAAAPPEAAWDAVTKLEEK